MKITSKKKVRIKGELTLPFTICVKEEGDGTDEVWIGIGSAGFGSTRADPIIVTVVNGCRGEEI